MTRFRFTITCRPGLDIILVRVITAWAMPGRVHLLKYKVPVPDRKNVVSSGVSISSSLITIADTSAGGFRRVDVRHVELFQNASGARRLRQTNSTCVHITFDINAKKELGIAEIYRPESLPK